MNSAVQFLSTYPELKEVVAISGRGGADALAAELCGALSLTRLTVFCDEEGAPAGADTDRNSEDRMARGADTARKSGESPAAGVNPASESGNGFAVGADTDLKSEDRPDGNTAGAASCQVVFRPLSELSSYSSQEQTFAVFFDGLCGAACPDGSTSCDHAAGTSDSAACDPAGSAVPESLRTLAALRPAFLAGTFDRPALDAFSVWEAFRTVSEHIYLCAYVVFRDGGHKNEILEWHRRPESDTELSVIFPMYNIEPYLDKCIESISAWDASYVEYLFVDDGSPDNSAAVVEKYAAADPRIKLLRKPNGGCASARQYGLDRAKGRYIGFIDPDDYIDPTMFSKLLRRAMEGTYEISWCGYKELYESTGLTADIDDLLGEPYSNGTADRRAIDELIAYRRIAIWRGIYLKEMIDRSGVHFYTDLRRFDDLPFKVETMACARSVVSIPEHLYYYRMARPGQDVAADDERLYVHFDIFKYLDEFIRRGKSMDQISLLEVVKIQTHRWALCKMRDEFVEPYCERARADLLSNMDLRDGRYYIKKYVGSTDAKFFEAICRGKTGRVKALIKAEKAKEKM